MSIINPVKYRATQYQTVINVPKPMMRSLPPCWDWEVESMETPIDLEMVSASAGQAVELGVVSAPERRQGEARGH